MSAAPMTNPANDLPRRIWSQLRGRPGENQRLRDIAGVLGVTAGTVRRYVREWAAGYCRYHTGWAYGENGMRPEPPAISVDCGGSLVYVYYPDAATFTVIHRRRGRAPVVSVRNR